MQVSKGALVASLEFSRLSVATAEDLHLIVLYFGRDSPPLGGVRTLPCRQATFLCAQLWAHARAALQRAELAAPLARPNNPLF
jgi:hypothetical protein